MKIKLIDAKPGQCRWPLWGDNERSGFVCAAPVQKASAYCAEHHTLCYVKPTQKVLRSLAASARKMDARIGRMQGNTVGVDTGFNTL